MNKMRYLNTKFWSDVFVHTLDPSEKLIYIYLITNPYTNISGVYEISIGQVAYDTGYENRVIENVFRRLTELGKINYENGWLIVRNFLKHQKPNPNILKGVTENIRELPRRLKLFISQDKLLLEIWKEAGYRIMEAFETPSTPLNGFELPKPKPKPKPKLFNSATSSVAKGDSDEETKNITAILTFFRDAFNPTLNYGNKTEREACRQLLRIHGLEKIEALIKFATTIRGQEFAPSVRSPSELARKWPNLQDFYQRSLQPKKGIIQSL